MIEQLQTLAVKVPTDNIPNAGVNANEIFENALGIVYFAAGIACVIAIIIGGILYATANGESDKIMAARKSIQYAVIGLVVIMMAFVITGFIVGRVG